MILMIAITFSIFVFRLLGGVWSETKTLYWDELLAFILPLVMFASGYPNYGLFNIAHAVVLWLIIIIIGTFLYGLFAFNNGHHGPDMYHEGDEIDNLDFGVFQVKAIKDRREIGDSLFRGMAYYGLHCLHHLFPTLDHSILPHLQDDFYKTCQEFNISFKRTNIIRAMIDQFKQLDRKEIQKIEFIV